MRLLVLQPAGEVYNHNCVRRWNHEDVSKNISTGYNIGDMFVHEASLKLIDFSYMESVPYQSSYSKEQIDRYNKEFDLCLIRGSNYINAKHDWSSMLPVIRHLDIPILAFGIGAQTQSYSDKLEIPESAKEALKIVSHKSEYIGVRGNYTANFLNSLGITNVQIIGCPSIFRNNKPELSVKLKPWESVKNVGITTHPYLGGNYCEDVKTTRQLQKQCIMSLSKQFNLSVYTQGCVAEKVLYYNYESMLDESIQSLIKAKWIDGLEDPFFSIYRSRLFHGESAEAYYSKSSTMDLVFGVRLHGNVTALANGVPAVYITYDSRTREFAELFNIPYYHITEEKEFQIEDYYHQELFDKFNRQLKTRYKIMAKFLDFNNVKHKMKVPETSPK